MFKILLTVSMLFSFSFAENIGLKKLSSKQMAKDYKEQGLDVLVKNFYAESVKLSMKFANNKENAKGLKVLDESDKKLLVKLVLAAEEITDKYDQSNLHYYGFAKLYKVIPLDLSLAIERSGLNAKEKEDMRNTLKNNLD